MSRFRSFAIVAAVLLAPTAANALERPKITTSRRGADLEIVVHNVTDYCGPSTDGTRVVKTSDSIRILRDRPSRATRCFDTRDVTFLVSDVNSGRYTITYERLPLIAPVRWLQVASTTLFVE